MYRIRSDFRAYGSSELINAAKINSQKAQINQTKYCMINRLVANGALRMSERGKWALAVEYFLIAGLSHLAFFRIINLY